mgnify:CR=1 FL=1
MRKSVAPNKQSTTSIFTKRRPARGFGLESSHVMPKAAPEQQAVQSKKPRGFDFNRISMRPQAKLTVNKPGDAYEQEADRVAQQVVQKMSESENQQPVEQQQELKQGQQQEKQIQTKSLADSITPVAQRQQEPEESQEQEKEEQQEQEQVQSKSINSTVQRQEQPEQEEQQQEEQVQAKSINSTVQRQEQPKQAQEQEQQQEEQVQTKSINSTVQRACQKCEHEEDKNIQTKSLVQQKSAGKGKDANAELESSIGQARGGGQPMADNVRQPMEEAIGADFSGVRIHTGSRADNLNKSIQAKAFTTGQDVFFGQGEYSPESSGGKELLAHELTHVVQQSGGGLQRKSAPAQSVKTNKVQTKVVSTSNSNSQIIQPKQIVQKEAEQEKQGESEQEAAQTSESQTQEQQIQAAPSKNFAADIPTPPGDGGTDGDGMGDTSPNDDKNRKTLQAKSLLQRKSVGDEESDDTELENSSTVKDNKIQTKNSSISGSGEQEVQTKENNETSQGSSMDDILDLAAPDPLDSKGKPDESEQHETDKVIDKFDDIDVTEAVETHEDAEESSDEVLGKHEKEVHEDFKEIIGDGYSIPETGNQDFVNIIEDLFGDSDVINIGNFFKQSDEPATTEIDDDINEALNPHYLEKIKAKEDYYFSQKKEAYDKPLRDLKSGTKLDVKEAQDQLDDKAKEKANKKADELELGDEDKKVVEDEINKNPLVNQEEYRDGFEDEDSLLAKAGKFGLRYLNPIGIFGTMTGWFDAGNVVDYLKEDNISQTLNSLSDWDNLSDNVRAYNIRQAITEGIKEAGKWLKFKLNQISNTVKRTLEDLLKVKEGLFKGTLQLFGMVIHGEFGKIAEGFTNLYLAAKKVPDKFETAVEEELLGGDENLDEPLTPELLGAAQEQGIDIGDPDTGSMDDLLSQAAPDQFDLQSDSKVEIPKPPWSTENVGVDEVEENMELSPELQNLIAKETDGDGTVMLAESNEESRSLDEIMSEANGEQQNDEEQQELIPDDGLTPRARASINSQLMMEGVKKWFSDNWKGLLAGFVGATAAIVGLLVGTGGAIAPVIGEIVEIIMGLFDIQFALDLTTRISTYLHDYINQAWDGDIEGGGKIFAKALAIVAIQVATLTVIKAAVRGAKAVGRAAIKGTKYIIKKGKVLLKGIAKTKIGKQFKNITDLGQRLLDRMRFKKLRVKVKNEEFRLEGFINPWILIAKGEIKTKNINKDTPNAIELPQEQLDILKKGKEITLPRVKTFEQARNKAQQIVGDWGSGVEHYESTMNSSDAKGKVVGLQSTDKQVRYRLDWDPTKHNHFNVEDYRGGKKNPIKIAIPFGEESSDSKKIFNRYLDNINSDKQRGSLW